ncbi:MULTISPECIES: response regulator [Vogesella]|jgi:two-component system nitrate/nitrite response regulator NarL|uniref:LuxR family two component transcriptional regulator n=1 Tax=Vogesella indigofera TaxID=45465 RepID=A0A495BL21_VOGIN|nr:MULTISPECIES: response regulator transcription factor [Vogesella]MCQ4143275.1 response regulator transcription factor [Vogesella sp. AC12]MDC7690271.1 response regulator transcription factor [Vogesella indigofera]MDC7697962.1 response regulator transcription factor [Vogesella indigofera]MDC7700231.1 response regulator transcription factor [Vogesella indigofera]MDC7706852.1 response regulator transcription factor [Vogesella indigofera]
MSTAIRILLVDDHTLFRSGLKALLQRQPDFEVIGEAADGLEGVKQAELLKPDVVLLDLDMPVMHGRDALSQILVTQPQLAVLMLTVSEDGEDLAECMKSGARGYLLKNINADFLLSSIRRAVDGDSVLSPEMTAKLVARLRAPVAEPRNQELDSLTPRERETLSYLASGASNKEIARALDLAESTIKVHVQNILRKLSLSSRVQAAVYAVEHGLDKA